MADGAHTQGETPKKRSKKPLLIGVGLAMLLGGGGFYGVYSGMVLGHSDPADSGHDTHAQAADLPAVAFVPIEPLIINLGHSGQSRHLKFRAELEVEPSHQDGVTTLLPRVMDVLNSYLRAVSLDDLEEPAALVKLRAQMLRRVQIVTGEGRVRDLLIMEFVLN